MEDNTLKIVSFDIFDTLLIRNVIKPTDVFRLIGEIRHDFTFIYRRVLAEKIARRIHKKNTKIDNIYAFPFLTKKEIELELRIEDLILEANPKIAKEYHNAVDHADAVYAISDMYLPSSFISNILTREGFNKFYRIYISCEYGKEKADGSLFKYFLDENHYNAEFVTHYGDNLISDIQNAKEIGINTVLINRDKNNLMKPVAKGLERIIEGFINHHISNIENQYEKIGYEFLGLFLFIGSDHFPVKYKIQLDNFLKCEKKSLKQIKLGSDKFIADVIDSKWSPFIRENRKKIAIKKIKIFFRDLLPIL